MDFGDNWGVRKLSGDSNLKRPSHQNERYNFESRREILWYAIDPHLIARLYGFTLHGLEGEEAKEMLKLKKVSSNTL